MGCFSWTCAKTHQPILAEDVGIPALSTVVALDAHGLAAHGVYDGYGRIQVSGEGPLDVADGVGRELKLVLAQFYDPATDTYATLGENQDDPTQGTGMSATFDRAALAAGGYASYAAFRQALRAEEARLAPFHALVEPRQQAADAYVRTLSSAEPWPIIWDYALEESLWSATVEYRDPAVPSVRVALMFDCMSALISTAAHATRAAAEA